MHAMFYTLYSAELYSRKYIFLCRDIGYIIASHRIAFKLQLHHLLSAVMTQRKLLHPSEGTLICKMEILLLTLESFKDYKR